jgi:hypothetical protein
MTLDLALILAAISIGSLHTLAPDHWLPFAALARAERWSARRTALVTAGCGMGHVTGSVALGLLGAWLGLELFEHIGHRLESVSGLLLVGFGAAYAAWGLHRGVANRAHRHAHAHGRAHAHPHGSCSASLSGEHHHADDSCHRRLTAWALFLLFSADPCVAVIPLMFAAAPLGWPATIAVAAAYEIATIATMVVLVLPAPAAVGAVRGAWVDRWGELLAGGIVTLVGVAVVSLGI